MRRENDRKCVVQVPKLPYTLKGIPGHKGIEKVLIPLGFSINFQALASSEVLI